jgi:hypothetical protein
VLAETVPLPGLDAAAMAEAYASGGWRVDAAALAALDLVRTGEDREAVVAALRALYLPWIDANATALQDLAAAGKVPFAQPGPPPKPGSGLALLFVDGLRMDLAQRLADLLRSSGAKVEAGWRWSGFPTITATCKPLASPAAGLLTAGPVEDLLPSFEAKPTTKRGFNGLMLHFRQVRRSCQLGSAACTSQGRSPDGRPPC